MASSPEYLAPSVHNTETLDIDIDPAITGMPHGSCSSVPPSTVSYSTPDPNVYSEVRKTSTHPIILSYPEAIIYIYLLLYKDQIGILFTQAEALSFPPTPLQS